MPTNSPKHGIAVGKFYPPHIGHHHLIETAKAECDVVTIAVCHSSVENISPEQRIEWLKAEHGTWNIDYISVKDDTPVLYTDETWGYFLDALMDGLWRKPRRDFPNIVYSGEAYAPEFALRLTRRYQRSSRDPLLLESYTFPDAVSFRILDRSVVGTSASAFRNAPADNWEQLAPSVKADLCKRVVVCGGESTGTTTLAKNLAEHYKTTCVPEYGRHFDWAVGKHHIWEPRDFNHIAEMQKLWEDNLARESHNGLLICDTDEFATDMFSQIYLGDTNWGVAAQAEETPADLYIVTSHVGVEFEDDGTRFNSGKREWSTDWLINTLPSRILLVLGTEEQRLKQAVDIIDEEILQWEIETPIEYR